MKWLNNFCSIFHKLWKLKSEILLMQRRLRCPCVIRSSAQLQQTWHIVLRQYSQKIVALIKLVLNGYHLYLTEEQASVSDTGSKFIAWITG